MSRAYPSSPAAARRSSRWPWLLGVLIVAALVAAGSVVGGGPLQVGGLNVDNRSGQESTQKHRRCRCRRAAAAARSANGRHRHPGRAASSPDRRVPHRNPNAGADRSARADLGASGRRGRRPRRASRGGRRGHRRLRASPPSCPAEQRGRKRHRCRGLSGRGYGERYQRPGQAGDRRDTKRGRLRRRQAPRRRRTLRSPRSMSTLGAGAPVTTTDSTICSVPTFRRASSDRSSSTATSASPNGPA